MSEAHPCPFDQAARHIADALAKLDVAEAQLAILDVWGELVRTAPLTTDLRLDASAIHVAGVIQARCQRLAALTQQFQGPQR